MFTDDQHFTASAAARGGDLITFIRQIENLDYMDALRLLATRPGWTCPRAGRRRIPQAAELVLKINRRRAPFPQQPHGRAGGAGAPISQSAGCPSPPFTRFGLGYAPDSWDDCSLTCR